MTDSVLNGLFLAHRRELQAFLMKKLRDAEVAADLTQETFLRYAEHVPDGAGSIANERSYLYRTANNLAIDYVRQQSRRRTDSASSDMLSDIADERPTQEQEADARLRLARLMAILGELPELTQNIFILNRVDGLTYVEVARRLSISESSVQKHLAKGLVHVTRRLRQPVSR